MPVLTSYPGLYIEEISSGVRTIMGVATSITAFVGRTKKGPVNDPVLINSFGDFERIFGGLNIDSSISYAVRDFYLNGGSQAIIVRLYRLGGSNKKAIIKRGGLNIESSSEGSWGNNIRIRVDTNASEEVAKRYGLTKDDLFNLLVHDNSTGAEERFLNVSIKDSPRRLDRVLENESLLIRVKGDLPNAVPTPHGPLEPSKKVWEDDNLSTGVLDYEKAADSEKLADYKDYVADQNKKEGIYALEKVDLFNLLCIPPDTRDEDTKIEVYSYAMKYCVDRRAMLIVDAPHQWISPQDITANNNKKLTDLGLSGNEARNAILYFPRIKEADPLREGQIDTFAPCGAIAGIMSRTDTQRGVWKAPAGIDATLAGAIDLKINLTDAENGMLNPLGINCLRTFPAIGRVAWGARTLRGADQLADEYKYVPIRRLALYIEESLFRGLKWVVFEPNDEPLWAQIRLNVGAFMHSLFTQGAFQGKMQQDAYFVKCDSETTTQDDRNKGIVNIVVGFAPLKPAEFVIIKIQQIAGQIQT